MGHFNISKKDSPYYGRIKLTPLNYTIHLAYSSLSWFLSQDGSILVLSIIKVLFYGGDEN